VGGKDGDATYACIAGRSGVIIKEIIGAITGNGYSVEGR
jgi:hypothetical protein